MKQRDLINLLNSAAAVLECGADFVSDRERADLVDELLSAARMLDKDRSVPDGISGQDRESYSDDQDRDSYYVPA